MSDNGQGNNGAGANGAASTNGSTSNEGGGGPDWSKFTESLEALNNGNGQLGGKLDTLIDTVKTGLTPREEVREPVKLDELSRDEFAAHILGTVSRSLQEEMSKALAPVISAVNGMQQSTASKEVNASISDLRGKHKDFNDWKTEMVAISRQHPTLSVPEIYTLAKSQNPDKAKELDTKYNPPEPPKERRQGFGGLTVFGRPSGLGTEGEKPASKSEAALDAYREVQARHSGVLRALEEM